MVRVCSTRAVAAGAMALMAATAPMTAVVAADVCAGTSYPVPPVTTMYQSTKDKSYGYAIVSPSCKVIEGTLDVDHETRALILTSSLEGATEVERIESLPALIDTFVTSGSPLSRGANLAGLEKLDKVLVYGAAGGDALELWTFPTTVDTLEINNVQINSLDKLQLPSSSRYFAFPGCQLKTASKLPMFVLELQLVENELKTADLPYPRMLQSVDLESNQIASIERITLPSTLREFKCRYTGVTTVRGVKWPAALTMLRFGYQPITTFEICETDAELFAKLEDFQVPTSQTSCDDPTAVLRTIQDSVFCVISDARFKALYGSHSSDEDSKSKSSSGSEDGSNEDSSSSKTHGTTSTSSSTNGVSGTDRESSLGPTSGSGNETTKASEGTSGGVSTGTRTSNTRVNGSRGKSGNSDSVNGVNESSKSSSSSTLLAIVVTIGAILAVAIAAIGYRLMIARRRHDDADKYESVTTPSTNDSNGSSLMDSMRSVDIREDKALYKYRIAMDDIKIGSQIAQGGFGAIYRGVYNNRDVAIKQLLPNAWRDDRKLNSFMDEMRLCSMLDHPRIVEFIGIAWSSIRDLSVVIEYMTGGDLHDVLLRQQVPASPQDWSNPWGSSSQIKGKTSIAKDVAEAIVYLHSFNSPILHRDLKARNVLLDSGGNAKLSDFGISRELSLEETMTGEVGTVAWIAPEVLRGERYSEKADVYSFGVLLVELDRCRHPYVGLQKADAQVAMAVSTGQLRPSTTDECPDSIRDLVDRCVAFDAEKRPTSTEVYYQLCQQLK